MILRLILLTSFCLWFPSAYKRWTHGFRCAKCALHWPDTPAWDTAAPNDAICTILRQPFFYLDKGAQAYVFFSADHRYVLKLLRFDACRMPFGQIGVRKIRKWFHLPEKHWMPFEAKVVKTLTSCKLSYDLAPQLTGVVWVHLNPRPIEGVPHICLTDRLGQGHRIAPARYRFVLQKKAEPFLSALLHAEDPTPLIDSFLFLLKELSCRGLANLDPTMGRNFGWVQGKVIQIDVGNFTFDPVRAQQDPFHFSARLRAWLIQHHLDVEKKL